MLLQLKYELNFTSTRATRGYGYRKCIRSWRVTVKFRESVILAVSVKCKLHYWL